MPNNCEQLSEEALYALVENAPLGVYVVDSQLRLRALNKAAEPVFRNVGSVIGRDLHEVIRVIWPERVADSALERFQHTLATGEPFVAPTLTESRRDIDRVESYEWQLHRIRMPDGSFGVACYFKDVTAIREAEEVLANAARRDAFLLRLNDRLRPLSEPKQVMTAAAEVLARELDVAGVGYSELASGGETLVVHGEFRDERLPGVHDTYSMSEVGKGFGAVLQAGEAIFSEDVFGDPRATAGTRAFQVRAAAVIPLIKHGRIAYLYAMHNELRAWPEWERQLIRETAERTRSAVEGARAENERHRQIVQFETLLNRAPLGMYLVDADFRIRQVNPAAQPLFGDIPDLIGRDLAEVMRLVWSDDTAADLVLRFRHTLRTGEPFEAHDRTEKRRGGTIEYYEWRIDRIPLPGGYGVVCYFRDVSASVRGRAAIAASEAASRASKDRHAFLLAFSDSLRPLSDPLEVQSVAARLLGRHLAASRALYGEVERCEGADYYSVARQYSEGQDDDAPEAHAFVGRFRAIDYGEALFHELHAGHTLVIDDIWREPRMTDRERKAYAANGMLSQISVPLIKKGRQVAFIAVQHVSPRSWTAAEVTLMEEAAERTWAAVERARAEARLRESQSRLQLALDAADMGTFVWKIREDRCEPDPRMLALFGLPKTSTLNPAAAVTALVHEDDRERYSAAIKRALDPKSAGSLREDFRVVLGDGSVHWLTITARVAFNDGGRHRPFRMVGMIADISARKQTEEALRQREELLEESDRRKDEFLAMLAHELRNPLAPIRTGLEMLRIADGEPGSFERVRVMMERQVGHMVRLVDDLLDVSRITSGKIRLQRQPESLSTLVSTAVEANRAALNAAKIDLRVDLPDEPLVVDVDPTRFVQVVSNLLHNAIKFTKAPGQIRIDARAEPGAKGQDEQLRLSVADTGVGISHEMLPRVFDLFMQGDVQSSQPGLGIGLALARRLIELHGGTIEASSAGPGQGSVFTIRLPHSIRARELTAVKQAQPKEIKHHVVVIDDNEDSADMTAMFVSSLGAESRVAYDGESGLRVVDEFKPDVVLLDIGMPGIDGYETCRRIRKAIGSDVLIVAMTGWGQERDKQEAKDAGFNAHLTKPVDPAMLKRLLSDSPPA